MFARNTYRSMTSQAWQGLLYVDYRGKAEEAESHLPLITTPLSTLRITSIPSNELWPFVGYSIFETLHCS